MEKRHSLVKSVVLYTDLKKINVEMANQKNFHHSHYAHIYPHLNLYHDICAYLFI